MHVSVCISIYTYAIIIRHMHIYLYIHEKNSFLRLAQSVDTEAHEICACDHFGLAKITQGRTISFSLNRFLLFGAPGGGPLEPARKHMQIEPSFASVALTTTALMPESMFLRPVQNKKWSWYARAMRRSYGMSHGTYDGIFLGISHARSSWDSGKSHGIYF